MKGKLIVIESGVDSSGKETQTKKLYNRLLEEFPQKNIHKIEYPNYKSDSSALVRMYLNGEFGNKAENINPYAVSTFFAVDRYASYQREWKEFYERGDIIIADRYTTSNMVHQTSKIKEKVKRKEYLDWLWDLEFNKFGLPVPDCVFFLDVPPKQSKKLMKKRENLDIHEKDYKYLRKTYKTSCWIANKYNWKIIDCVKNNKLKSIKEIHEKIYELVLNWI